MITGAEQWNEGWDWRCEAVNPAEEWERWLRRQVPSLDLLVLPGAFDQARIEIDAMKLASKSIPGPVKAQIRGLIQPFVAAGTSKISDQEINAARLISNTNILASLYLRDSFEAITLDGLIVLRSPTTYDVIMNKEHLKISAADILAGHAPEEYVSQLLTLIHELVHVKQYSSLGFDAFLTNYLVETISMGYGSDSFEQEAFGFERTVARTIPGCQPVQKQNIGFTRDSDCVTYGSIAYALAQGMNISQRAVAAHPGNWRLAAQWYASCLDGRERAGIPGRQIPKDQCVAATEQRFHLTPERTQYPIVMKDSKLPTRSTKMPDGRSVLVSPKPTWQPEDKTPWHK